MLLALLLYYTIQYTIYVVYYIIKCKWRCANSVLFNIFNIGYLLDYQ